MMKFIENIRKANKRDEGTAWIYFTLLNLQILALILSPYCFGFSSDLIKLFIIFITPEANHYLLVSINFGFFLFIIVSILFLLVKYQYLQQSKIARVIAGPIQNICGFLLAIFKYLFLIPVLCLNFSTFKQTSELIILIFSIMNLLIALTISLFGLYINWSYRFFQLDFCNRRENSIIHFILLVGFVGCNQIFDPEIGAWILIAMSVWEIFSLLLIIQYQNIQKSSLRFSFIHIFFSIVIMFDFQKQTNSINNIKLLTILVYKFILAYLAADLATQRITKAILTWNFKKLSFLKPQFQIEIIQQKMTSQEAENMSESRIQGMSELDFRFQDFQRSSNLENGGDQQAKLMSSGDNKRNAFNGMIILSQLFYSIKARNKEIPNSTLILEWDFVWQKVNQLVLAHHLGCEKTECKCKKKKNLRKNEEVWVLKDLQRLLVKVQSYSNSDFKLLIMKIYMHVQLNKKPLKGYYQIMRMKKLNLSAVDKLDIESLIFETRQCFDQLFLKNNVTNSILPLYMVFEVQSVILKVKNGIKECTDATIRFIQLFFHETLKISHIRKISEELLGIKKQINDNLEFTVVKYPEIKEVSLLSYLFFQYFQPYRSKEKQFRSIYHEKSITKRMLQKYDMDVFSPEFGIIYIDLAGTEKGKIKKVTKTVCDFYGTKIEEMVSCNINQFMPKIYSIFHNRFLSNFIENGKINILKSRERMLFGKNRRKFIFPINATIKTEHLFNDEFGVSGLISGHSTNSDFFMVTKSGLFLETTYNFFNEILSSALKSDVEKINRFNIFRMIPELLRIVKENEFQTRPSKIHESLYIYSKESELFYEKFKNKKCGDNSEISKSIMSFSYNSEFVSRDSSYQRSEIQINDEFMSAVYKQFLIDLPIFKLNAMKIQFKVSPLKTSQFQILLIEIINKTELHFPYKDIIEQYHPILQKMGSNDDVQCIEKKMADALKVIESEDQHDLQMEINFTKFQKEKQEQKNGKRRNSRQPIVKIQTEKNRCLEQPSLSGKSLQSQQKVQIEGEMEGNSENSSVTDLTTGQLKKQTLINGFNSNNRAIKMNLLVFLIVSAILMISMGIIIFSKIIKDFETISAIQKKSMNMLNLTIMFEFKLASIEMSEFFSLYNENDLAQTAKTFSDKLNYQFTEEVLSLPELYSNQDIRSGYPNEQINVYEPGTGNYVNLTLFELFSQIQYIFYDMKPVNLEFLRKNYESIHKKFGSLAEDIIEEIKNTLNPQKELIIILECAYEFLIIILGCSFIIGIRYYMKEEKKILSLLSTNSLKQMLKAKQRLFYLKNVLKYQNLQEQINKVMAFQYDFNFGKTFDPKNELAQRNSKIIFDESQNFKKINPKFMLLLFFLFLIFFSSLFSFYFVLQFDQMTRLETSAQILKHFHFLTVKPSVLLNICLSNANRISKNESVFIYSDVLYEEVDSEYFELTNFLASEEDKNVILVTPEDETSREWYSSEVCDIASNLCSEEEQKKSLIVEYHIFELKNKLNFLGPDKLKIAEKIDPLIIDEWHIQNNISELLPWVFHIQYYSNEETNNYYEQNILKLIAENRKIFIYSFASVFPVYIILIVIIIYKFVEYSNSIIKEAQITFIHFPFHVLTENTYLNSYFNEKTKNGE